MEGITMTQLHIQVGSQLVQLLQPFSLKVKSMIPHALPGRVPSLLGHCYNPSLGKSVIFFNMAILLKGVLSTW